MALLAKYIAFKVLLEGPDFYGKQRENFKIKKALGKPLVINKVDNLRYDEEGGKLQSIFGKLFMLLPYKLIKLIYQSFFFYFFPMIVTFIPFRRIMLFRTTV